MRVSGAALFVAAWTIAGVALTGGAAAGGSHAGARSPLDAARHDVDSSDYLGARGALDTALRAGTASPEDLAELYNLSGIVEGALGDEQAATASFAKWLSLDPKGTLPPGTSPKITRPYDAALAIVKAKRPLEVKVETSATPPSVTLIVVNDPEKLVAGVRVFAVADGQPEAKLEAKLEAPQLTLDVPHGRRIDLRVQAVDAHGNRLVELGSREVPIVITGADAAAGPHSANPGLVAVHEHAHEGASSPRPVYLRWWLWSAVGVAFAGAGTYFGLEARSDADRLSALNAESQQHAFTEARDLESTTRREALFCNIGLGVAGAFAIGASILYLTEPRLETRVSAVPVRGGGAVVFGGRF